MERKETLEGESYYKGTGAYQKEYNHVVETLIPGDGEAETKHGEMVRIIDNFAMDFIQNDGEDTIDAITEDCHQCNGTGWETKNWRDKNDSDFEEVKEDCSVCGGNCRIKKGGKFNRYWEGRFTYLKYALPSIERNKLEAFEEFVLKNKGDDSIIDKLTDSIMYVVLTTENEPR